MAVSRVYRESGGAVALVEVREVVLRSVHGVSMAAGGAGIFVGKAHFSCIELMLAVFA